jgi:hypothetical protein
VRVEGGIHRLAHTTVAAREHSWQQGCLRTPPPPLGIAAPSTSSVRVLPGPSAWDSPFSSLMPIGTTVSSAGCMHMERTAPLKPLSRETCAHTRHPACGPESDTPQIPPLAPAVIQACKLLQGHSTEGSSGYGLLRTALETELEYARRARRSKRTPVGCALPQPGFLCWSYACLHRALTSAKSAVSQTGCSPGPRSWHS